MPNTSVSWKALLPMSDWKTWPVIATIGTLSMNASEIAVRRFIAPGPLVTMQTPTLPVERAYPCAIKPPPCSCLGRTTRIFLDLVKALCRSMDEPPG